MTDDQLIEHTKRLIAIESTVNNIPKLREAYQFVVDILRSSGKDITIEEFESNDRPSFLAYQGKQRPERFHIVLNVHVDVVPGQKDQFKAAIKDEKIYGRGVYDEKGAAVILADLFCEFVDKVPYPLAFQVVTDEESNGYNGTRYQIEQGVRADFVICAECGRRTNVHEIANEAKGTALAEITLKGNAAHAAYPWRGDNAAAKAAHFIHAVHERFPRPGEESRETTMTITSVVSSGGAFTRIPDTAKIFIDTRYVPEDPNFRSRDHFINLIHEMDPEAIVDVIVFDAPLYSDPRNPLLQTLKAAAEKVEGAPFAFVRRHATSDGRHYGAVGDQACEFGIAGEDQHGDNEHITLKAFWNFRDTMRDFLERTIKPEAKTKTISKTRVKNLVSV